MERIFLTSIPKCGTHLMLGLFESLGFRRQRPDDLRYRTAWESRTRLHRLFGKDADAEEMARLSSDANDGREALIKSLKRAPSASIVGHHYSFDPELLNALCELGYVVIFMLRDPRDQMISYRNHVLRERDSDHHVRFAGQSAERTYFDLLYGAPSDSSGGPVSSVCALYESYEGWLKSRSVLNVGFPHIIGPKGHGLRLRQLFEADRLLAKTGCSPQVNRDEALREMFDPKHSLFVSGRSGQWLTEFSAELKRQFERECAGRLARYLEFLSEGNPPGWDAFAHCPHNLRRAWWLAERDLAAAAGELREARLEVARVHEIADRIEADSQERLALIGRLAAQVQELRAARR